jgi:hypothetical protein
MKRFVLILIGLAMFMMANVSEAAKSSTKIMAVDGRAGWVDGFKIGSAVLKKSHKKKLKKIADHLSKDESTDIILKGSYSAEKIYNGCYLYKDAKDGRTMFSLKPVANAKDSTRITDENKCQDILGQIRALRAAEYLESLGIRADRIYQVASADAAIRPGPHRKNRAVSYWLADVPKSYVVQRISDSGDMLTIHLKLDRFYIFKKPFIVLKYKAKQAWNRRNTNLFMREP